MTEFRPKKFGFPKAEKLTGKKKIEELFKNGSSIFLHPFLSKYHLREQDVNRLLITVPKKKFKRAVDRNLIKRRIREAYRLNKSLLTENLDKRCDVGLIYQDSKILSFKEIEKKLITLLSRLNSEIKSHEEKN